MRGAASLVFQAAAEMKAAQERLAADNAVLSASNAALEEDVEKKDQEVSGGHAAQEHDEMHRYASHDTRHDVSHDVHDASGASVVPFPCVHPSHPGCV